MTYGEGYCYASNTWTGDTNISYVASWYSYGTPPTWPTNNLTPTKYGWPDIGYETTPPPPAPASITYPSMSTNGNWTVSWAASTGATSYELQEDTNASFSTGMTVYTGTSLSFGITGKQNGIFYYRVRAHGIGGPSPWTTGSGGCTVILLPAAPASISVPTGSATGHFVVSWSSATGATTYELDESTDGQASWHNVFSGSGLNWSANGVPDGTYYYRVRSGNVAGFSGYTYATNGCVVMRPPVAPPSVTAPFQDDDGIYSISWIPSATTGVVYRVEEDSSPAFTNPLLLYLGLATSFQVGGGAFPNNPRQNGTYFYRVRAEKGSNSSGWTYSSNGCTVFLPAPSAPAMVWVEDPSGTPVTRTTGSPDIDGNYNVVWNPVSSATGYQLQESTDIGFSGAFTIYSGSATSTAIISNPGTPPNGQTYFYRIRAGNSSGWSPWTSYNQGCHVQIPAPGNVPSIRVEDPLGFVAPQPDPDGSFYVAWQTATGATHYMVEEATNSSFAGASLLYTGTSINVHLTGKPNGHYYYRVRAWNTSGYSASYTNDLTGIEVLLPAPAPGSLTVPSSSSTGNFSVTWTQSATATGYDLQESVNAGAFSTIYTGSNLFFNLTGKTDGVYAYRVRASNSSGTSTWTNGANACTVLFPPIQPASITVPAGSVTGNFTVSWGVCASAAFFELEESSDNKSSWTSVDSNIPQGTFTYNISGKTSGLFWYRVRGRNNSGTGPFVESSNGCQINPPAAPTGLNCPGTSATGIWTVTWNTATGANQYVLEESDNGGTSWAAVYTGAGTSFNVTGKTTGSFQYRVSAVNGAGSSAPSTIVTCTMVPPAIPATISVPTNSISGFYFVSWSNSPGANRYVLEESINGGASWISPALFDGNATSFYVTSRSNGSYRYRVQAYNANGGSGWRTSINSCLVILMSPGAPTSITVPASSVTGSYSVTWAAVWGATAYELQEATQSDFSDAQTVYSGSANSYFVAGKSNGRYFYQVRSSNPVGYSGYTAGLNACQVTLLQPGVPGNFTVPFSSFSGIYGLSWTTGSGAMWYVIEEDVNQNFSSPRVVYIGGKTSCWILGRSNGSYYYRLQSANTVGTSSWVSGSNPCMVAVISPAIGIFQGPANPTSTRELPGSANVPVLQVGIATGAGGNVVISSVTVSGTGSGNESTGVTLVRLYDDADGDGVITVADRQLGTGQVYTADNGNVTFSGLTENLAPLRTYTWLVTYDFAGAAMIGEEYIASIAANGDMTGTDPVYGNNMVPQGAPVTGGTKTLTTMGTGDLQVFSGINSPDSATIQPGTADVEVLQVNLVAGTLEGASVSGIRLWAIGSGNDATEVINVEIALDVNANGAIDPGDTVLASGVFTTDNGSLSVTFSSPVQISAGASRKLVVAYDFSQSISGSQNFTTGLLSSSDVTAVGTVSAMPSSVSGPPVIGDYMTVYVQPTQVPKLDPEYSMGGCAGGAGGVSPAGWFAPWLLLALAVFAVSARLRRARN